MKITELFSIVRPAGLGIALMAVLPFARAQTVISITDFEASEGYVFGNLNGQNGWQVTQGAAAIVGTAPFSGSQLMTLSPNSPPTIVTQSFSQFANQSVLFVDFYSQPTANADVTLTTLFDVDSSRVGFVKVGSTGQVLAFDGNGSNGGNWVNTAVTLPVDQFGLAQEWVRFTLRQDYAAKKWDLYLNGTMAGHGYGFRDNTKTAFSLFTLQAADSGSVAFDSFYVSSENPLFVDLDKDGIDDTWEQRYFGTLAYGPTDDPGDVGRTLAESYQQGLNPWPEPVISGGLKVWYRADLGVAKDVNNKVSLWSDLSGNSSHLAQASNTSRQPTWAGTSLALYGKPAVQFDGTTFLSTDGAIDLLAGSSEQTVIAVIVPGATQPAYSSIADLSSESSSGFVFGQLGGQTNQYELWWMDTANTGWQSGPGVTTSAGQLQVLSLTKTGATAISYLNGVVQGTGAAPATILTPVAAFAVGNRASGNYGFNGQLAELLVYNRALSNIERSQLEQQLLARYTNPDTDGDGLPDAWEQKYFGTLAYGPTDDPGGVGRSLLQSYQQGLSPWPAASVTSGLRAWYRADLGVTKDASNKASLWVDLSGNGSHVVQAGVHQPTWAVSNVLNGHAGLQFDGTTLLTTSASVDLQGGSNNQTVIAVVVPAATQPAYSSIVDFNSDSGRGWVFGQLGNQTNQYELWWMDAAQTGWQSSPGVTLSGGQMQVMSLTKSGASATSYLNGVAQGTGPAPATLLAPAAPLSVGCRVSGSYGYIGQVAEVLIYNRALSDAERQQIEQQLTVRYLNQDLDGDGLSDAWEQKYFGTLAYGPTDDPGGVGRTLLQSFQQGLNPWPAASVASGLRAWYRADLGVTKDAGNKVSLWTDLSGNGSHVVQASPRQPAWAGNVAALYGKPSVQFDGTTFLSTGGAIDLLAGSSDQTVIAVIVPGATQPSSSSIADFSSETSSGFVLGQLGGQTNQYQLSWMDTARSGWQSSPAVAATANQVQVLSLTKSGASGSSYLNGMLQGTGAAPASILTPITAFSLGTRATGNYGYNGQIAELLVYNRALTITERSQIEQQALTRYVNPDTDGDGLPDAWEQKYFGSLSYGATDDPGNVGRTLAQSYQQGLSPWPAATVSSGLRVWYRADLGVTKDASSKVSQWVDLSGNGAHVVQIANVTQQPVWTSNVAALNGKPAVQFDGTMGLTSAGAVDVQGGTNDQTFIAIVVPGATQQAYSSIVDLSSDTTGKGWVLGQLGSQTNQYELSWMDAAQTGWQSGPGATVVAGQVQVLTFTKSGTNATTYLNGLAQGTTSAPAALLAPAAAFAVGNRVNAIYGFTGQIAELLIYNRALTTAEQSQIEQQALTRYINLDSDGDGLPDAWEQKYFGTLGYAATEDPGNVGRTLLQSYQQGLSPWPTATVASGLRAWYRADLGVAKDASNKISRWADLSGNASHVLQATASRQPTWAGNVTALQGKAAVQFDGTTLLTTGASADVQAGSNDQTVIAVVVPDVTQPAYSSIVDHNSDSGRGWVLGQLGTQTNQYQLWWMDAAQTGWQPSPGVTATAGQVQVLTLAKSGTTATSYLNGTAQSTGAAPASLLDPAALLAIGNRVSTLYGYNGQVAELLLYNRALSTAERQSVESALEQRYAQLPNQPPVVSLTTPTNGSSYSAPASLTLAATASDPDGTIIKVEFYQNGTKLGQSTVAPYQWSVTNLAAGTYSFFARAFDNTNASTDSANVAVSAVSPPSVALTAPSAGAVFIQPAPISLTASASSPNSTIAKVEFYQGTTKIGETTQAPYVFSWSSVAAGSYVVSAKVVDAMGATAVSAQVPITIIAAPRIYLRADAGITPDSNGRISVWRDQSGHGNDATQAANGNKPTLATVALNGLPAVQFTASSSNFFNLPASVMNGATAVDAFAVVKTVGSGNLWYLGPYGGSSYPAASGAVTDDIGGNAIAQEGVPLVSLSNFHLYNVTAQAGKWTSRFNGSVFYSRDNNVVNFRPDCYLGLVFNGYMAEVIIFDHVLSDSERDALGSYLTQKYALAVPAPAAATNLTATMISSTQVSLSWSSANSTTAGVVYAIERATGTSAFSTIAEVTDSTAFFDQGGAANTTYVYRVKAQTYGGTAVYSNSATASTPSAIASLPRNGMRLWLSADTALASAPGRVVTWIDQSGNSNNATQLNLNNEPTLAANSINGRPAIHFSNSGAAQFFNLPNLMSGAAAGDVFVVLKATSSSDGQNHPLWFFGTSSGSYYPNSNGQIYDDFGSTTFTQEGLPPGNLTAVHCYNVTSQNGEWTSRFDGSVFYTRNTNAVAFTTSPYIGLGFNGDIAEIIVYDHVLSATERETVGFYLNRKYAFTVDQAFGNFRDSNSDGLVDNVDRALGINPFTLDVDGDGVPNWLEILNGTDPFNPDTDGDGVPDGLDAFPLNPDRSQPLSPDPSHPAPPVIMLTKPADAVPIP